MEQSPEKKSGVPEDASTRDRIIEAALTEFAEQGKAGARVDRIAERAAVNKAMIYYHFSSKENLYLEVVRALYVDLGNKARRIVVETKDLKEALRSLARMHVSLFRHQSHFRTMMMRELADPNPEVIERVALAFGATGLVQTIQQRLTQGIKEGRFKKIDERQMIVSFISMSIGYFVIEPIISRVLEIEDPDRFVEERIDIIVDIFIKGIEVR